MILPCKACKGSGKINRNYSLMGMYQNQPCPACRGAGEFEIAMSLEKLVVCKFCQGEGSVQPTTLLNFSTTEICPARKGLGLIERPVVGTQQGGQNETSVPKTARLSRYDFDIAVSFAGEDRTKVKQYTDILISKGLTVFYDEYKQADLWGANLYDKLDEVYRTKALFCVIFVSKYYAQKVWTNHERKSAQARALQENREYVLPVRLDDTQISGIPTTIGQVDLRETSIIKLADMTIEKVTKLKAS